MADTKKKDTHRSEKWWVKQRHHDFEVVQSTGRPEHKTAPKERIGRVHGPFSSKEEAEAHVSKRYARTLKGAAEGGR